MSIVGRQPEWRPDGLIGSPPTSGSATRVAAVPSAESCQVISRTSVGVPACHVRLAGGEPARLLEVGVHDHPHQAALAAHVDVGQVGRRPA